MHRGPFGDRGNFDKNFKKFFKFHKKKSSSGIDTHNPHFQRHIDIAFDPVYEQMFDDMIMTHEIADSLFSPFAKRNGILDRSYLWRNATVYYFIDDEYNDNHRDVIKYGIDMIQKTTCINFVELKFPGQARGPYVHINSGIGCYSSIGSKCLNGVCKMSLQIPVRLFRSTLDPGFSKLHSENPLPQFQSTSPPSSHFSFKMNNFFYKFS